MFDRYSVIAKKFKRRSQKNFQNQTSGRPSKKQRHRGSISVKRAIGHKDPFKARLSYTRNSWPSWATPDPVQYEQTDASACRGVRGWLSRVYSHFVPYGFYWSTPGVLALWQWMPAPAEPFDFPKVNFLHECCSWNRLPNTSIVYRKSLRNLTLVDWAWLLVYDIFIILGVFNVTYISPHINTFWKVLGEPPTLLRSISVI